MPLRSDPGRLPRRNHYQEGPDFLFLATQGGRPPGTEEASSVASAVRMRARALRRWHDGEVQQHGVAARALHERPDGRAVGGAGDEVAFPMARDDTIGDLGRSLADHHHGLDEPAAALAGATARFATGASAAE